MESKGTVLVVDDNETVLDTLRMVLESEGYDVLTSPTVLCANIITENQPDLILLDVRMPGMSGDVAGGIFQRTRGLVRKGLIVFHSNLPVEELDRLAREAQVAGFMQKCSDSGELLRQVDHWIQTSRARTR